MRYLTKSRFKLAVECPAKLFYSGKREEYQDLSAEDDFLAMLAEGGYQVGKLAQQWYSNGIEIEARTNLEAEAQTLELLERDNVVLFEPAIRVGDFFVRIDILVKKGRHFELIEVKAKSYDSLNPQIMGATGVIKSEMLPYIQDVAFQAWVLEQAFPESEIKTFLMMPDKAKKAQVDGVNQIFRVVGRSQVQIRNPAGLNLRQLAKDLLAKVCVDDYVSQVSHKPLAFPGGPKVLSDAASDWAESYRLDRKIPPLIGMQCGNCQFRGDLNGFLKSGFHECWREVLDWQDKDFEDGTILDLWNCRKKQKLIDRSIYKLSQVRREDLGDFEDNPGENGLSVPQRQWLQCLSIRDGSLHHAYDYGGFYFDFELAEKEMARWRYPLHFIDFETSAVALPFYKDMRPYQSVAFQFSHHIMERDDSVRHAGQFLCVEPGEYPNYAFARELKAQLENDDGSVFMWSHHENTILTHILLQLEEDPNPPQDAKSLALFLRTLIKGGDRAMVDLRVLAQRAFFHPDTKGSSSLKKVLPAILKASQLLRDTYSQPIYGAPDGIPSLNFANVAGFSWLDVSDGKISDPYAKLRQYAFEMLPNEATPEDKASLIAEGGAAATAYARLQFEELDINTRQRIQSALLRYCELDTLAMVMVVQAWKEFSEYLPSAQIRR